MAGEWPFPAGDDGEDGGVECSGVPERGTGECQAVAVPLPVGVAAAQLGGDAPLGGGIVVVDGLVQELPEFGVGQVLQHASHQSAKSLRTSPNVKS